MGFVVLEDKRLKSLQWSSDSKRVLLAAGVEVVELTRPEMDEFRGKDASRETYKIDVPTRTLRPQVAVRKMVLVEYELADGEGAGGGGEDMPPDLAAEFLEFLLSPDFQAAIPTTNWMYPVRLPTDGLPAGFAPPPESPPLVYPSTTVRDNRQAWIDEWLTAMSR